MDPRKTYGDKGMGIIITAINFFYQILVYMILGRAVLSWFVRNPYDNLGKFYTLLIQLTEPMLAPCRKLLARFNLMGTIDLSPILAMIGLSIIRRILVAIIVMIAY